MGDGVYRSKNQGHIWIKESEGLGSADIYLLLASDDDYIYASGWANDFFRTKYPTVVSVEDITVVLKTYHLSQNYPNPFNPTTKIKYSVPHVETRNASSLQMVTLKVYDVLGNEIATLVNEEKQPGTYEVEFDGKQLPSGIYFYKLNAGKFSLTKKMVLIK